MLQKTKSNLQWVILTCSLAKIKNNYNFQYKLLVVFSIILVYNEVDSEVQYVIYKIRGDFEDECRKTFKINTHTQRERERQGDRGGPFVELRS